MDGHDPADEDHWWYPDDYPGEAAAVPAADAAHDNFLDMFANSTEDLFKLVWEGGTAGRPAVSSIPSSPPPPELPRVPLEPPPSDDMMAAWLYPIVSGETDQAGDITKVPAKVKNEPEPLTMDSVSKEKLPAKEDMSADKNTNTRSDSSERRKAVSGGSSRTARSSHYSGIHNITEKRRRCKISDRLRTLQQLVPGCDKSVQSNQVSTLEQTIQYMKSLQQQVASAAAAVYPIVHLPPRVPVPMPIPAAATGQVRPGTVVPMLPYGAMIPYAHYHAVMMPAAASSPVPATPAAPEGQCSISTEQQWKHTREKGKRRL